MEKKYDGLSSSNQETCFGNVEGGRYDLEDSFVGEICRHIGDAFRVSWGEKDITLRLLNSALGNDVKDLLERYLGSNLESLLESLNHKMGTSASVNHNYALHAKFNDFTEELTKGAHDGNGKN